MRAIDRLVAAALLVVPPILLAWALVLIAQQDISIYSFPQYAAYAAAVILYVTYLRTPPYDQRTFKRTLFPEAPNEVDELLKTQCKGRPIVKMIIEILSEHPNLNQSDVQRELKANGLDVTYTTVKNHLDNMKAMALVDAIEEPTYAKDFALTEQGKWCADAIKIRLPPSHLRRLALQCLARKLPRYPAEKIE